MEHHPNDVVVAKAPPPASLSHDLLEGVDEIAAFLGKSRRQAYHLLHSGKLKGAFKLGRRWNARRSVLLAEIERLEQQHSGEAA